MPTRSIEHRTTVPEIRKGDTVVVLAGKDAGKRGVVERVIRKDPSPTPLRSGVPPRVHARVASAWSSRASTSPSKHTKPRQRSSGGPGPMPRSTAAGSSTSRRRCPISRVMLVCTHCDRPTRIAHRTLDNGKRVRVCRHCGEPLEGQLVNGAPGAVPGARSCRRSRSSSATRTRCRCRGSTKIVVNIGLGEALQNAKAIDAAVGDLTLITGQKPIVTRAKRSIAQFRLRTGNPIGAKVTLRGERMWDFLERLTRVALPAHPRLPGRARQVVRRARQLLASASGSSSPSRRSTTTRWTVSAGWRSAS